MPRTFRYVFTWFDKYENYIDLMLDHEHYYSLEEFKAMIIQILAKLFVEYGVPADTTSVILTFEDLNKQDVLDAFQTKGFFPSTVSSTHWITSQDRNIVKGVVDTMNQLFQSSS